MTFKMPPLPEPARRATYATSRNTESVRKGFEVGGYEKTPPLFDDEQMHDYGRAVLEAVAEWLIASQYPQADDIADELHAATKEIYDLPT